LVLDILLGYEEASMAKKKLEISHASQILTNARQILVLSYLFNYYCNKSLIYKQGGIRAQYSTGGYFCFFLDSVHH